MTKQGYVKWYNEARGYGVIVDRKDGDNVYVHYSEILDSEHLWLEEGEEVAFEPEDGKHGTEARNVRRCDSSNRPQPRHYG